MRVHVAHVGALQTRVVEEHRGLVVRQLADLGLQPGGQNDELSVLGPGLVAGGLQLS